MAVVSSPTGRALGVDLGARRIGLALSDRTRTVAAPHEVLRRGADHAQDHEAIVSIAREEGVTTIVVGLPLSLSGKSGPAARAALAGQRLAAVGRAGAASVCLPGACGRGVTARP